MIKSNFKNAIRGMLKQKIFASIKIGGFALGIAACLLISLFIKDELNYDKHYPDSNRIYRFVTTYHLKEFSGKGIFSPAPLAKVLKDDFSEIELAGRINPVENFGAGSNEIRRTDEVQNSYDEGFTYADQSLLDIFQIPLVLGDASHALDSPLSMVISKRKAEKYFPNENPIGKTLILNNDTKRIYTIKGVMENPPSNSHFQYDFLLSLFEQVFYEGESKNWMANNYPTYVLVRPGTDIAVLEKKFNQITEKYYAPALKKSGNVYADRATELLSFELQPVGDIHLKSAEIENDGLSHGDIRFIYIFGIIAGCILIIALINFINLTTSKSINIVREVGLRKTIGANRKNLVCTILTDSILYSFISFIIGSLSAWLILPLFNLLANKSIIFPWNEWWLFPLLISASLIVGIIAGLYPAFYLSSFNPIQSLKNQVNTIDRGINPRSILVVFQFAASIVLIMGTFIIYQQMEYILHKKLGFDKEQVLLLYGANTLGTNIPSLKEELLKLPDVKNVSVSGYLPVESTFRDGNGFWNEGKSTEDESVQGQMWIVDEDYIKTMGMRIVEGRDFSKEISNDSKSIIINQTMAKKLGLTNPLGKGITNFSKKVWTIIGVVEDFHFESFKENIGGLCMILGQSPQIISVKLNEAGITGTLQSITKVWNNFSPNQPIRYSFMDEKFSIMYSDVKRTGRILSAFTSLAIIVACLGLFAFSLSIIEKRTKEVGVRKVNGARISEVMVMLNKDFVKWVVIAFVIATPIAWYFMNKWLESFAYKTTLSWWIFALAGLLALGIALLTVSFQSWKAATRNPVEALRYE
ncbi:MAG: FtsX-like permease family protein [Bacteroidia bacterium]|nr:FtsX-like permease family protein [Bacteroidia bacterium]